MAAPTANTYAEKWTYQRTYDLLLAVDRTSQNPDCLYLGQALETSGLYTDIWRYWQRKWKKRHEIIQIMKQIMQRFEVRLFTKMAGKDIPARVAMFALQHHYGWGRDPQPATEDLSYVDQELMHEPLAIEQTAVTEQIEQPTATSEPYKPTPEDIDALARTPFNQYQVKIYNQLHPTETIPTTAVWYPGTSPADQPAIPFDAGYFIVS